MTIEHAWTDADYKAKLLADPRSALSEAGIDLPPGMAIEVLVDTDDTRHFVLPPSPLAADEMSIEDLENVAGGLGSSDSLDSVVKSI